jgi:MurNAc alpha-1-phosphate uridylyltransferase
MKKNIRTAMILAAGLGSRMMPLTANTPKALIEFQGKPMLERVIGYITETGIDNIIINTHYLYDQIADFINTNRQRFPAEFHISHEPDILGSGGGILNAMQNIVNEPYLVVNCDVLLWGGNPLLLLIQKWDAVAMDALLLVHDKDKLLTPKSGDMDIDVNGNILRDTPRRQYIMAGCSIFAPTYFAGRKVEFFTTPAIFSQFSTRYFAIPNPYNWLDIGTLQDLEYANQHCML